MEVVSNQEENTPNDNDQQQLSQNKVERSIEQTPFQSQPLED